MQTDGNLAEAASLFADPSRGAMLTALLDGRFHTASELAYMAGIKQQTASYHLAKLAGGGLIKTEQHGRHRYYTLASPEVAEVLETVLSIAKPPEIRSLRQSSQMKALKSGRTCYDHLAGELGVTVTEAMQQAGFIVLAEKEWQVTEKGERFFAEFGLNLQALRKKRRTFARACLDWSERKHHLAGALGCELTNKWFELGWIEKIADSRAVKLTAKGRAGFASTFEAHM
ncbi:MAG TPA: metalloregulator ArsR/SmtB family transcription factor [Bacillales bacterium]|nr:metalloregulator ArsR/SmtB family transcription factor [Bacillales bacterium]